MTKMAVLGQYLLWVTASTILPRAMSLLATQARGVNVPVRCRWCGRLPGSITVKRGSFHVLFKVLELLDEHFGHVGVAGCGGRVFWRVHIRG